MSHPVQGRSCHAPANGNGTKRQHVAVPLEPKYLDPREGVLPEHGFAFLGQLIHSIDAISFDITLSLSLRNQESHREQEKNKGGENALSIFENSNMYSFFVNKITETQGVSPEKGAVTNDHYNLFVKRDGTERQFTFYAMFVVVSRDDPDEPVAYCLSELMFSVDLNDPNFDQHFSPSKSLVDCSNKNQEYYANYPKMSINNYIHPYN